MRSKPAKSSPRSNSLSSGAVSDRNSTSCEVGVVSTDLGWIAWAAHGRMLARLSFGHDSRSAALAALGLPNGSCSVSPEAWPELSERLAAYAAGRPVDFLDIAISVEHLSPFERRVVAQCRLIAPGSTLSYGGLAVKAGASRAARAVGNVMASNRLPLVVPCHRVVHADGRIGNYSAPSGRAMKLRLLEMEGAMLPGTAGLPKSTNHPRSYENPKRPGRSARHPKSKSIGLASRQPALL